MSSLGRVLSSSLSFLFFLSFPTNLSAQSSAYQRASDDGEVVRRKIYPKEKKFELSVPNLGFVMNQSYVNTILISGGGNYYLSETLGIGVDVSIASNSDKDERFCIEHFYYDPSDEVGLACGDASNLVNRDLDGDGFPRFGPAYVPIREVNSIYTINMIWTPVYGKQLLMLSATSYFDLYFEGGLGIVQSTYYGKRDFLRNGNVPRDIYTEVDDTADEVARQEAARKNAGIGATVDDFDSWGTPGRPDARNENHVMLNIGVGQKFHFARRFHLKIYVRNMTILGTAAGYDRLFAIYGGGGVRF
ncbi:MAG: outer membrane beta-barrel domain-containing protein [Oligoflexus sp.]